MSALEQLLSPHVQYPVFPALLPATQVVQHRYRAAFAATRGDLDAVLRLRFDVFNGEMGEGLDHSVHTLRDFDDFDPVFHHLMVVDQPASSVVGTYRMQTSGMAYCHRGFYSDAEFDLGVMPRHILDNAVEIGRTCVAREHRNSVVLLLLWKGLARYLASTGCRYLFGCCSMPSQQPEYGLAALRYFEAHGHMHPDFRVRPRPGWSCEADTPVTAWPQVTLPPLFRLYFRYGAKVCGPPAIDRQFKTIDFLLLMDIANLETRARERLFDETLQ